MNIYTKAFKTKYEAHRIIDALGKNSDVFAWFWNDGNIVDREQATHDAVEAVKALTGAETATVLTINGIEARNNYGMDVIPPRLRMDLVIVFAE